MKETYDVIVLGLGAMGSAAVYQLAKRGTKVLGIDQFSPPHTLGSTHGDTRITRQAIGEGEQYVPIVLRAYEIWDEIERETGKQLLFKVGGLIMSGETEDSPQQTGFLETTISAAKRYNIEHELLDAADLRKRFPQFNITNQDQGYFEKNAGYLIPELAVSSQLELAKKYGASIHTNEKVRGWHIQDGFVQVETSNDVYHAEKIILTLGSWVAEFLPKELSSFFKIYRQVLYWFDFDKSDFELLSPPQMPIFIWEYGNAENDAIYGFPAINGPRGGLKVASEQYSISTNPDTVEREVAQSEIDYMYTHFLQERLPLLKPNCIKSASCLYTVTPDSHFVIDFHPDNDQVIVASPCSGHGFKHSAAVGEILADLAIHGHAQIDISAFGIERF